jgi:transcriptional regulator with AAA-type ATPase domain
MTPAFRRCSGPKKIGTCWRGWKLTKRVAVNRFLDDIKSGASDRELMRKYGVSPRELCLLLLQAVDMRLINLSELRSAAQAPPAVQLEDCRAVTRIKIDSDLSISLLQGEARGSVLDISEKGFQGKGLIVKVSEKMNIKIVADCYLPGYTVDTIANCRWIDKVAEPGDRRAGFEIVSVREGNLSHLCEYLRSLTSGGNPDGFGSGALPKINQSYCLAGEAGDSLTVWQSDCQSKAMRELLEKSRIAARSDSTILLCGETGSGKDYLAKYIHRHSNRAAAPYLNFNCSAIPSNLAESELFGHEAGAFTGATSQKKGLLALAPGGTLLLNEIGELPLMVQAKLLTFLDTKCFRSVGGLRDLSADARIIAATNRNLEDEVSNGTFRKDLFYRLNVVPLYVPPLRERIEDLRSLIQNFVARISKEWALEHRIFVDKRTLSLLEAYEWPGNIRELHNRLERSLILSGGRQISFSLMFDGAPKDKWPLNLEFGSGQNLNEFIREARRRVVLEALARSQGSRQTAAKMLGITRYSLKRHMTNLGLMNG